MHCFKRERRNDREICILLWSILKVILSLFRVCVDVSLVTRVLLWSVYRSRLMRMCVNRFLSVIIFLLVFRPKCHQAWCLIKFGYQFFPKQKQKGTKIHINAIYMHYEQMGKVSIVNCMWHHRILRSVVYLNKLPKLLSCLQVIAHTNISHNLVWYVYNVCIQSCLSLTSLKVVVFQKVYVNTLLTSLRYVRTAVLW